MNSLVKEKNVTINVGGINILLEIEDYFLRERAIQFFRPLLSDNHAKVHLLIQSNGELYLRDIEHDEIRVLKVHSNSSDNLLYLLKGLGCAVWQLKGRTHLFLHAASVLWDDKAILIVGPPGSGKSTLTLQLGLEGLQVLSDELVLLDHETFKVSPVKTCIHLSEDSVKLLNIPNSKLFFFPHSWNVERKKCWYMMDDRILNCPQKLDIKALIFPEFISNLESIEVEKLSVPRSIFFLTKQIKNSSIMDATILGRLFNYVSGILSVKITYGLSPEKVSMALRAIL